MKKAERFRKQFSDVLQIPKDLALQESIVTMMGTCDIVIENYKKLEEYDRFHIKLRTHCGSLLISGENLVIVYYRMDELKITGQIDCISRVK